MPEVNRRATLGAPSPVTEEKQPPEHRIESVKKESCVMYGQKRAKNKKHGGSCSTSTARTPHDEACWLHGTLAEIFKLIVPPSSSIFLAKSATPVTWYEPIILWVPSGSCEVPPAAGAAYVTFTCRQTIRWLHHTMLKVETTGFQGNR